MKPSIIYKMYRNEMTPEDHRQMGKYLAEAQRAMAGAFNIATMNLAKNHPDLRPVKTAYAKVCDLSTRFETNMKIQYGSRFSDEEIHDIYHQGPPAEKVVECPITINGIPGGALYNG